MKPKLLILLLFAGGSLSGQVDIRLFTGLKPDTVIFAVTRGEYLLDPFTSDSILINKDNPVIIARHNGMLAVKARYSAGFLADSVRFKAKTGNDVFSLSSVGGNGLRRYYSGHLKCVADLNTILMINSCDEEEYIAGVVKAEGGSGKHIEYFKTQAVLVRTYMYKYMNRHSADGYDLCDNTHCQAYEGLCSDGTITGAAGSTKGIVVLDSDSVLIISAYHSNCGGETASSEGVWITPVPYLKKVSDPYCVEARNARWQISYPANEWLNLIKKISHTEADISLSDSKFSQLSRLADYSAGQITVPLTSIRSELSLRSTFFNVVPEGDQVILSGRGYGHGVGLCQEGAMVMAAKGFTFRQIIDFYYSGVIIADISSAIPASGGAYIKSE